ncbi:hypothetical protein PENTCL1PPCAC_12542, partial [Pristionchus entomophagus]
DLTKACKTIFVRGTTQITGYALHQVCKMPQSSAIKRGHSEENGESPVKKRGAKEEGEETLSNMDIVIDDGADTIVEDKEHMDYMPQSSARKREYSEGNGESPVKKRGVKEEGEKNDSKEEVQGDMMNQEPLSNMEIVIEEKAIDVGSDSVVEDTDSKDYFNILGL